MEKEIKVGDSIFWWGDYYDGENEDGSYKTKYLSGVNKVIEVDSKFLDEICIKLDNKKLMFYEKEHINWELIKTELIEKCVSCGEDTPYIIDMPIDLRDYYIDGAGQLCKKCFDDIFH